MSQRKISMTNPVAKNMSKFNQSKVYRDKKKDYQRKGKYSYSTSLVQESYKFPDI
jgi:hypothetical protein